ncbi:DUF4142 domain-containing protein [Inquilinus sp. CA228]|uniref:DUF4142 domain-containing protein n=1 Tax=Inquilinus sp. CA228 TaxID=3455609 RepID=UPI003F8D7DCF
MSYRIAAGVLTTLLLTTSPARPQDTAATSLSGEISSGSISLRGSKIGPSGTVTDQSLPADGIFILQMAVGGFVMIEFGHLAEQKSTNNAVRGFARQIIEEHTRVRDRLVDLIRASGFRYSVDLDPEHRAIHGLLVQLSGIAFDQAYVAGQITDLTTLSQILVYEIGSGQDTALRTFASETLPVILQQLRTAQTIAVVLADQIATSSQ